MTDLADNDDRRDVLHMYEAFVSGHEETLKEELESGNFGEDFADAIHICRKLLEEVKRLRNEKSAEDRIRDLEDRIGKASIMLADWDGYYNPDRRKGNAEELASLIEDAYRALQGKSWREN